MKYATPAWAIFVTLFYNTAGSCATETQLKGPFNMGKLNFGPGTTVVFRELSVKDKEDKKDKKDDDATKSSNSTALLHGIAQSCTQIGQVVGAPSKKEKQQGILNLLGTIFGTAASISANNENTEDNDKPNQQNSKKRSFNDEYSTRIADLTSDFIDLVQLDQPRRTFSTQAPYLHQLQSLNSRKAVKAIVERVMRGIKKDLFLQELLQEMYRYLCDALAQEMSALQQTKAPVIQETPCNCAQTN